MTERTTRTGERDREMFQGQQFERAVRRAMGAADVRSLAELARESRVQRDTLYSWFRGDRPPKPETLAKVARTLGVELADLWDYGPGPPAPGGDDTARLVRALADEIHEWRSEARERQLVILEQIGVVRTLLEASRATLPGEPGSAPAAPPSSRRHR